MEPILVRVAATFKYDPQIVHLFDSEIGPVVPIRYWVQHPETGEGTEITLDRCSGKRNDLYYFSEKGKQDEKVNANGTTVCGMCGHHSTEETSPAT